MVPLWVIVRFRSNWNWKLYELNYPLAECEHPLRNCLLFANFSCAAFFAWITPHAILATISILAVAVSPLVKNSFPPIIFTTQFYLHYLPNFKLKHLKATPIETHDFHLPFSSITSNMTLGPIECSHSCSLPVSMATPSICWNEHWLTPNDKQKNQHGKQ